MSRRPARSARPAEPAKPARRTPGPAARGTNARNTRREAGTVEATFADERSARRAAQRLEREGATARIGDPRDVEASMRAEMHDEVESMVMGVGNVGPFTKSMTKGILVATPVGTAAGALLGLVLGLFPWGLTVSAGWRLGLFAIAGAVAGATAGFVVGGFVRPELEHESERPMAAESGQTVGVRTKDAADARQAERTLRRSGAKRVDRLDGRRHPRGASSEDKSRPVRGS